MHLAEYKKKGLCRQLIVIGCLPERFREKIQDSLPEVDLFLGTGAFGRLINSIKNPYENRGCIFFEPGFNWTSEYKSMQLKSKALFAYLKIAEGCDKRCTYCIIPKLKGKQKSRPPKDIITEAKMLINRGIKEIVLVAQETTFYGKDLDAYYDISILLEEISNMSPDVWIRLLYGHPESVSEKLIKTIAANKNISPYFDIPVQHVSKQVLKRMGRNYEVYDLYRLFEKIRAIIPDAVLRTTVILGFPGERNEDFKELVNFIKNVRFDNLGAFIYSDFDDLLSHSLSNHVPVKKAKSRYDEIMSCQKDISFQINRQYIGKKLKVLIEDAPQIDILTGRTFFQAPEVDGITYIKANKMSYGKFSDIIITDAFAYDLVGEPA